MYEIQQLNERHFRILDFTLEGKSPTQIAELLDMTPVGIITVQKSPSFQHELAIRRKHIAETHDENIALHREDKALEKLKDSALAAATRISAEVNSANAGIALRASESILDRIGIGKVDKHQIEEKSVSINVSTTDAALIAETLRMIA